MSFTGHPWKVVETGWDPGQMRLGESLTSLGALLDPPVGKSGVNHRMRRLEAIYDEIVASMDVLKKEDTP